MIHWFKKHPKHLAAESAALKRDINYKELYQQRDNLFISHGDIVIRLDKIYRFPILIVYPEATPYVLPSIYPLKESLSSEQVESLAKEPFEKVFSELLPYIEFYYHLRHQNQSGSLCILEWDNIDDGSKFYGISSILKRVRDWYKGIITGTFPPDSQEVEFHAHFINVEEGFKFMYPSSFLDEKYFEGEVYGLFYNYLPKGKYYRYDRHIYFGCLMVGKNKNGFYEYNDFPLQSFFFEEGIKNAIELIEKEESLKRLIHSRRLIKTGWYQVSTEPSPFKTIEELIKIIGEGDYSLGLKRIQPFYLLELKTKPEIFYISIRFPTRKGLQEFQLFKVIKKVEVSGVLIGASDDETFKQLINSYELVYAVQCEKFTDESYHQRNIGRAERNILKDKIVNVIGVGALGSEIADALGKAGIGSLYLFDNQELKGSNSVRHLAGINQIGVSKIEAVAEIISNHNPFINLSILGSNINSIDLNDCFIDGSIAVCSIADDNTEGFLNERAVIANKVVYYTRALRGAKVARIFRVIPGKDACFNCLDLYRKEGKEFITIPDDEDLPTLKNECNNPVRPASAADLKLISALTSRIILDELQQGFGEVNQWIWSSELIEPLEPFKLHIQTINPHMHCYYCNHEKMVNVTLPLLIQERMQELIAQNPVVETGGVLAGYLDKIGNVIVTNASGPGPKAIQSSSRFEKDVEYCQSFLDNLFVSSNKHISYIGEWHSHPSEKNKPSGTDIKSLTAIAYQKEYLTDMPIMIIFSNTGAPSCTVHPAGKTYYEAELKVQTDIN